MLFVNCLKVESYIWMDELNHAAVVSTQNQLFE